MIIKKKIELQYGDGWIFHHLNEIEELLEEYGMGSLRIIDGKMYFYYNDADTVEEILKELVGGKVKPIEDGIDVYFCSNWAPMTFDIIWDSKKQIGYAWPGFKFKTVKDFRVYQREFYKYKRQSKQNSKDFNEWIKNINVDGCWADWQQEKIMQFALTYCDYNDEEKERIKKIYNL